MSTAIFDDFANAELNGRSELRANDSLLVNRLWLHEASLGLTACAILLITVVFIVPFSESWASPSTYSDLDGSGRLEAAARGGSLARKMAIASLGLFGLVVALVPGGKRLRANGLLGFLCVAYLFWCAMSWLWADDVALSLRRWIAFMCEVMAAAEIARRVSMRQFVWIVFTCTLAWLSLGFFCEVSQGVFQPWVTGHRFAGVFHPNIMGANAAILVLASLYLFAHSSRNRRMLIAVALVGFAFLLLTRSRTSLATMFVSLAALHIYSASASRKLVYAAIAGVCVISIFVAVDTKAFTLSDDTAALGREDKEFSTLTGRLPLWEELVEDYVPERPFLGHGYGAFWSERRISDLSQSQGWAVSHAHSSYIDLVLNLGVIGAALCVSVMVVATLAALRRESRHAGDGYGFVAMLVIYGLTTGLTETYVGLTWFLSFFGVCSICFLLFDKERLARQHIAPPVWIDDSASAPESVDRQQLLAPTTGVSERKL